MPKQLTPFGIQTVVLSYLPVAFIAKRYNVAMYVIAAKFQRYYIVIYNMLTASTVTTDTLSTSIIHMGSPHIGSLYMVQRYTGYLYTGEPFYIYNFLYRAYMDITDIRCRGKRLFYKLFAWGATTRRRMGTPIDPYAVNIRHPWQAGTG